MNLQHLQSLLTDFNPHVGVEEASTIPGSWYSDSDFYKFETQNYLKKFWQPVAPLAWFKESGDYTSGTFLNEPYFVIRTSPTEVKAFYNVCRHHAACLLEGHGPNKTGKTNDIVCPYHGWTYDMAGGLKKAPSLGPVKNFKKDTMGLKEIPLKIWGPFVFLNFSSEVQPMAKDWENLLGLMKKTKFEDLQFICRRAYTFNCNWKVYIDNYLDGGYHVDILHKGLAGQLDMDAYKTENFENWTLQSCEASDSPEAKNGDFKDRIGSGAYYAWMYPNFVINRYGPIMDTNWVVPLGVDRCVTIFDYYYSSACTPEFIEKSLVASDKVQEEDIAICESVQKGLSSSGYHVGRYSALLEGGMHLFHRKLSMDMKQSLENLLQKKN